MCLPAVTTENLNETTTVTVPDAENTARINTVTSGDMSKYCIEQPYVLAFRVAAPAQKWGRPRVRIYDDCVLPAN